LNSEESVALNLLVFPNQLFHNHAGLKLRPSRVVLIEDSLFFGDSHYPMKFHKQKLWLHRATMKRYGQWLESKGFETEYLEYDSKPDLLSRQLKSIAKKMKSTPAKFLVAEPTDFILEKRLHRICESLNVPCEFLPNPGFINQPHENQEYRASKKRWFMADFYKWQRRRLDILMEGDQPVGEQWSFDKENQKKGAKEKA
jgi:deoxyribodipyrimidine photolyase-related protein